MDRGGIEESMARAPLAHVAGVTISTEGRGARHSSVGPALLQPGDLEECIGLASAADAFRQHGGPLGSISGTGLQTCAEGPLAGKPAALFHLHRKCARWQEDDSWFR